MGGVMIDVTEPDGGVFTHLLIRSQCRVKVGRIMNPEKILLGVTQLPRPDQSFCPED